MRIWNSIKKFLLKDKWKEDENSVYFHEDSFCQVEFLPTENLFQLKKENGKIKDFSKKHLDGNGFTDIYQRSEIKIKIIDREIVFNELDLLIKELGFKRIDKVYEGYGSTSWKCKGCFVYILNEAKIFVSKKDFKVIEFWVDEFRFFEEENIKNILAKALFEVGNKYNLILNDWNLTATIDLKNKERIRQYLNEEIEN
ncbi:hypothetical protein [Tenacibaculum sp. 1_MG-2023]|uniref:hypothetical protein n=1 Tax=Tenacibaculum sp. 1_MG-2023 TaxID=3062653 RepID=UPI0026E43218|nr:hypothetical protein [Tenacibaculum sp. 1_MG-2023]MDO6598571.1 hypothetical protein [Tenacibaculum sp. 1_MG-2023]